MAGLRLAAHNAHRVDLDGRRILFHVPTTSLFELDDVAAELLELCAGQAEISEADVQSRFDGRHPPARVVETIQELLDLEILQNGVPRPLNQPPVAVQHYPLSTLVLNVNTGCNLSCSYCYKEDLATPDQGQKMTFETAARAFELLLAEGAARERLNLVFFGGEPLSNLPLLRAMVEHAERRAAEAGKTVDFSLTTNGTLLTEPLVDWLSAHRVGVTLSMDGPKALHDRHRRTIGGKGTYDLVATKARMLLERHQTRPVGARVTLTKGVTDVVAIHRHLRDELGFFEVGYAPVTAGDIDRFNLDEAELAEVFAGLKTLGLAYRDQALAGHNTGFANLHQLMTDLAEGTRKALPCGAGLGMLAVDRSGGLNLCHRFTGSSLPTFGDLDSGIDKARLGAFLEEAQERTGRPCETCRIRNLCAGGCYHERYARYGDPLHPAAHYCELMRDWIDFGIQVYAAIMAGNPGFFERHVAPRRAREPALARAPLS